jgi:hypothetical protein
MCSFLKIVQLAFYFAIAVALLSVPPFAAIAGVVVVAFVVAYFTKMFEE